jgi:hypothetical protein
MEGLVIFGFVEMISVARSKDEREDAKARSREEEKENPLPLSFFFASSCLRVFAFFY